MIHCFENNGMRIVLDVHSGSVHVVDELAFDLLSHFSNSLPDICPSDLIDALSARYKRDDVLGTYAELLELQQGGLLYS